MSGYFTTYGKSEAGTEDPNATRICLQCGNVYQGARSGLVCVACGASTRLIDRSRPFSRALNAAILHMADHLRITWEWADEAHPAPTNLPDIQEAVARNRLRVAREGCDNTIFADREVNGAFRAWHDVTHARLEADLTLLGETVTAEAQISDLRKLFPGHHEFGLWEKLIWLEVVGQAVHLEVTGQFVSDQYAWTLQQFSPSQRAAHFATQTMEGTAA